MVDKENKKGAAPREAPTNTQITPETANVCEFHHLCPYQIYWVVIYPITCDTVLSQATQIHFTEKIPTLFIVSMLPKGAWQPFSLVEDPSKGIVRSVKIVRGVCQDCKGL